jgi:hypothetical protein
MSDGTGGRTSSGMETRGRVRAALEHREGVLGSGSPDQVRADVRRRIGDLAPGGGFVIASVHNEQANVPPDNVAAMWQAVELYGCHPLAVPADVPGGDT